MNLHRILRTILTPATACLIGLSAGAWARPPEIAARPLGMGGAFLAVADDANALAWNPAGLPRLQRLCTGQNRGI